MERKNYTKKFKEYAVKWSYERSSQSALAKELGISSTLLSKWCKEFAEYGSASFQDEEWSVSLMNSVGLRISKKPLKIRN